MRNKSWQRVCLGFSLLFILTGSASAALDAWCAHVTDTAGWKTSITFYNAGLSPVTATVTRYGPDGAPFGGLLQITAPPLAWAGVPSTELNYNGTARLTAPSDLEVKLSYQFGDSPSVCEFFLAGETAPEWMLPNTVRAWMNYTGVALMNPGETAISVTLEARLNGSLVAAATATVPPRGQYLRLSDGIWAGTLYPGFDTVRITSSAPIPSPIDITGNFAGDRHLFFSGRPIPFSYRPGDLTAADPFVGNLRYVPAGTFSQGSPEGEPCRSVSERQFSHSLTQALAVMETEVSRQMWADLRAVQPTLPADPTNLTYGAGMSNPVQSVTWYEAVLFANLLSVQQGLTPCYYTDAGFTNPLSAANYETDTVYCHWNAVGYRLPTEGEWEHFCRAGTTGPFWINEPNYTSGNCDSGSSAGMYPQLETADWFWPNSETLYTSSPIGQKAANPWNLKDVQGNVQEKCWDWTEPYPAGAVTDYRGASSGSYRVARGGSWASNAWGLRAAIRGNRLPDSRDKVVGLRLVRTVQ